MTSVLSAFILGQALVLFSLASASLAQEPAIQFLNLPEELRDIPLAKDRIFDDINQDGRVDLLFIEKESLYLSYQETDGSFSEFAVLNIPLRGAVDFADVVAGGEKEICVMHERGISCFQKESGRWGTVPLLLVEMPTVYDGGAISSLTREYFAVDLDGDDVPELILWCRQACGFYRRDNSGSYQLNQTFPLEARTYLKSPGLSVSHSPLAWLLGGDRRYLYHKEWPVPVRYLNWTKESVVSDFLIGDMNRDGGKDFVRVQSKEVRSPGKGVSTVFEYQIYFFQEDKKFAAEPGRIILDPHGAWLSSTCTDIDGDGSLDLLAYQMKAEGNLLQRPRLRFELFLQMEDGGYPEKPSQTLETSDYPLGAEPLVDVNGDGFKDLALVHPETKGFSLGSMIRKFVEESINAEVRVLPFQPRQGFSRPGMIRKRVSLSFAAGIPVNVSGDLNGDGLKDLLVVSSDRLKIYPLHEAKLTFSGKPWKDIGIPPHGMHEVKDLDGDQKSEIILYYPERIGILRLN